MLLFLLFYFLSSGVYHREYLKTYSSIINFARISQLPNMPQYQFQPGYSSEVGALDIVHKRQEENTIHSERDKKRVRDRSDRIIGALQKTCIVKIIAKRKRCAQSHYYGGPLFINNTIKRYGFDTLHHCVYNI